MPLKEETNMILLLARREPDHLYKPECFLDMTMQEALQYESDITTEAMKLDDTILDCMVYTKKEFGLSNSSNLSQALLDLPVWYTQFSSKYKALKKLDVVSWEE
jgi:hypothetical protein